MSIKPWPDVESENGALPIQAAGDVRRAQGFGSFDTTGVNIAPPSPPPPPDVFGRWWKELVAIVVGLATVGAATWALGRQFFLTREEWNQEVKSLLEMNSSISRLRESIDDQSHRLKSIGETVDTIDRRLIRLELKKR